MLHGKKIVLGVSGGIAAYKSCELIRRLQDHGARVQVVMTESATRFVTPLTFQALSGQPVYVDAWDDRIANHMPHIELSRDADVILVAPASADLMARLANGLANDLLSTLCLARECPLVLAPAMNRQMWENPATQRNVRTLLDDQIALLGPAAGEQACGEVGVGRMLEPSDILAHLAALFTEKSLRGRRVFITAGPTYEAIDPVRGITNRSSGKMGFAIAQAAFRAGADVTVVAGPCCLETPVGVQRINVMSAREMLNAVEAQMPHDARQDIFIAVAAVADWRVADVADQKIKKQAADQTLSLALTQNPDILATVAQRQHPPYCVGFAAESENLIEYATKKRLSKGIPLLIGNIGPATFGQDANELLIVDAHGVTPVARADKDTLARRVIEEIARRLPKQTQQDD